MVEGGGLERKKRGEKVVWKKKKKRKQAGAGGRRHTLFLPRLLLLLSVLLWRMKTNERSGVEDHRAPTAPLPLYLSLCSPLLSHPFPLSFIPPSVPSSPSTLLSSSLFHYLLPSLPPSVSFHVVTHYSADISPSVPPSLRQSLPYWCWPSPLCLGLDGAEGERGGDVPDGQTLNSRGAGRDGAMKGETRKKRRKGERRT